MQKKKSIVSQVIDKKWHIIIATIILEAITLFFRFIMNMEATRDTASTIGVLTFGIRVHHGYIGLLLVLVAWIFAMEWTRVWSWILIIGLALFFSDIIHHFMVLWPVTGNPEFHLLYPQL